MSTFERKIFLNLISETMVYSPSEIDSFANQLVEQATECPSIEIATATMLRKIANLVHFTDLIFSDIPVEEWDDTPQPRKDKRMIEIEIKKRTMIGRLEYILANANCIPTLAHLDADTIKMLINLLRMSAAWKLAAKELREKLKISEMMEHGGILGIQEYMKLTR